MPLLTVRDLTSLHLGPLSFELAAGERLALSGPSGAGKSLLLRALADLDPHGGELALAGVDALRMRAAEWRRQVAYLPAESAWWHDLVGAHFCQLPKPAELEALGFDPGVLQWQVARCSTGERQRLALLRLITPGPRVLLLDEPTAALDPENVTRVERLLLDYCQQREAGLIWVSHDPAQIARIGERHLRLQGGQIVTGT